MNKAWQNIFQEQKKANKYPCMHMSLHPSSLKLLEHKVCKVICTTLETKGQADIQFTLANKKYQQSRH